MLLTLGAAPLIAAGLLPAMDRATSARGLWIGSVAFAAVLWFWHSPAPYDATLRNNGVYWLMQLSIIGSAVYFWIEVLRSNALAAFFAVTVTCVQMSLLGALLTFAGHPLFTVYEFTTIPWGLSQLQDQQLGGLLMWIPAGLLLTIYSVIALGLGLSRLEQCGPEKSTSRGLEGATA
jgi:putative membrane protein